MEPGTPEAAAILVLAMEHSGRLGHRYIGGEHLLLALVSFGQPAGALLREHGVTPQRVEEEIVRQAGHGAGAGLFGSLDRDALAAIGIDLDTVRARIESSFEPDALAHAGRAVERGARPARLNLPRPRRDVPAWLMARWLRCRAPAMEPIPLRAATGLWRDDGGTPVFIPFAPSAREFWRTSAMRRGPARPGPRHRARRSRDHRHERRAGTSHPVSARRVSTGAARAILDRCRQPS